MGFFSRSKKKKPEKDDGRLEGGGEAAPPTETLRGLPKKTGPPTGDVELKEPEEVPARERAELVRREEEEALVKEALARAQPVEVVEIKEDTPPKKTSSFARFLMKLAEQSNHRNWSPNSVGEKVFLSRKEAQAFAREMRQAGYRAKVVRLKDGIYKVYLYRRGGGKASFDFNMRGVKTFKFDIGLSGKRGKKSSLGKFDLDLGGLDEFEEFKLNLKGLEDFKF